jgi:hypothetical protein
MSIVQKLTEGIVNRDLGKEGTALINKWEQTGLLEGLHNDSVRNSMSRLLENQAKELLREASSMGAGADVEGFAAVAFPLVRRVFGNLIANDLVSVQPMSLPSGLIFFLDFTYGGVVQDPTGERLGFVPGNSVYGGGAVASQITGGVDLSGHDGEDAGGPYNLRNGYSSPTGSAIATSPGVAISGNIDGNSAVGDNALSNGWTSAIGGDGLSAQYISAQILRYDPDLTSGSSFAVLTQDMTGNQFNYDDLVGIDLVFSGTDATDGNVVCVRRLTSLSKSADLSTTSDTVVRIVAVGTGSAAAIAQAVDNATITCPIIENFAGTGGAVGAVLPAATWGLENNQNIPEIDIKVDSVAVTAVTKKLKAKWTPELGQDLNAYHNLDAEVELTQILSEQIALEIDQEILEDLRAGATAGVRFWSRAAGRFLNRQTGAEIGVSSTPDFTGNVSEWYETLIETINDVSAQIHRKTLRGAANFCVVSPEVANILEFTAGFRANVTADSDKGDAGAVKVGSLSKKFDVIVDPYFPRNLVLVGRRGSSFLESGYVYAPYVPLQTTPTIFGVEDFVPRKGVMTRYAKKMVRPDMYGLVVVRDLV